MATRRAVRRIPPPRTLALDSIAELQAFCQSLRRRWRLPYLRVALRVPGLRSARNEHYERSINRQLRREPGWPALWTALTCTACALAFPVPPAGVASLPAVAAWVAEVALGWVVGWGIGHAGAIALSRWHIGRLCRQAQVEAAGAPR